MGETSSHFPVYSELANEAPALLDVQPGRSAVRDEEAARDSDREHPIGYVHLVVRRAQKNPDEVICHVVFAFDKRTNTLSASGVLPYDEVEDVGNGQLAITGGTGEYAGWRGVVNVEALGPHRWTVSGGT